jgi:hypothetical protein
MQEGKRKRDSKKKVKFDDIKETKEKHKEKFNATSTYEDIIDTLSVSPSASDKNSVKWQDQLNDYIILFLKYSFLVVLLTLNFLGLSVSLNCNADQEMFTRVVSAIFAFFFGFVYLLINYYTYKVMSQGKMCKMNQDKLFPFKV